MLSPEPQPDPQLLWLMCGPGLLSFFGVGWGEPPLPCAILLPERIILHGRQRFCIPPESLPKYRPWNLSPSGPLNWGQNGSWICWMECLQSEAREGPWPPEYFFLPEDLPAAWGKLLMGSLKFSQSWISVLVSRHPAGPSGHLEVSQWLVLFLPQIRNVGTGLCTDTKHGTLGSPLRLETCIRGRGEAAWNSMQVRAT